jgi:hypothetical protein
MSKKQNIPGRLFFFRARCAGKEKYYKEKDTRLFFTKDTIKITSPNRVQVKLPKYQSVLI